MTDGRRSRIVRVLAALAPSLCAACAATLVIGIDLAQAARVEFGAFDTLAITGFIALVAVPTLFVLSLALRRLTRAWRRMPSIAPTTVASWLIVGVLAVGAFAWTLFRCTWLLASWTQFKPKVVTLAQPAIAVFAALVIALAAGPAARGVAHVLERRAPRLRPRTTLVALLVLVAVVLAVVWRFSIVPRMYPALLERDSWLGPTGRLVAPVVALAFLLGLPAVWSHIAVRLSGVLAVALALTSVIAAGATIRSRANTALTIWAEQPVAGAVIEWTFSLSAIRADLPATVAPVPRHGAEHRDVVVIVVEGLRGDYTPPLRALVAITMPATRALADRSATAPSMYAASSSPSFALAAITIGTGADRIRGARTDNGELRSLDPRHVTLAERLRNGGYTTAAFVCCPEHYGVGARLGLSRGFDRVEGATTSTELAKRAAAVLTAPRTSPRFVWLHLADPARWQSLDSAAELPREAYEVTLAETDRAVAALVAALALLPPDEAPYVIIVGAYAEALGERGTRGHGTDLSDLQTHVPFIASGPGIAHTSIAGPTSTLDLVPTILDLAGFEPPRGARIDGLSLVPQMRAHAAAPATGRVVTSALPLEQPSTILVEGRWKLFASGSYTEIYDTNDSNERTGRASEHPDIAARLRARLNARRATARLDPF